MEYQNIIFGFVIGLPAFVLSVYSARTAAEKSSADAIDSLNSTVGGLVKSRDDMIRRMLVIEKANNEMKAKLLEYVQGSGVLYNQLVDADNVPSWTPPHITPEAKTKKVKRWD